MVGHLAVFDEWTEIQSFHEGRFMEKLSRGAFRKTLNESKPRVTLNHGHDPDLGDKVLGSIKSLAEDERGVHYEVELFEGVPPLVLNGLRAREYGSSFRFSVVRDEWEDDPERSSFNPEGLPERTIQEVKLYEFGPVTFPAYEGATAGIRSMTDRHGGGRALLERLPELLDEPLFLEEFIRAVERLRELRALSTKNLPNPEAGKEGGAEEETPPHSDDKTSTPKKEPEQSTPRAGSRDPLYHGKKEKESWRL